MRRLVPFGIALGFVALDAPSLASGGATFIERPAAGPPSGFLEMFVAGVIPTEGGPAVVLQDASEEHLLPIWIGLGEAHAIQLRLERKRFPRPLTHDLLESILADLGGELLKIHVDDLKGDTFVGTIFVRKGQKIVHFDARPSDSIALALGNRAPIYVSKAILATVNSRRLEEEKKEGSEPRSGEGPEAPEAFENPPEGVETL